MKFAVASFIAALVAVSAVVASPVPETKKRDAQAFNPLATGSDPLHKREAEESPDASAQESEEMNPSSGNHRFDEFADILGKIFPAKE